LTGLINIIFGIIPEALYFTLFLIIGKGLKEKRMTFFVMMLAQYIIIKYFIQFDVWFQIIYTFMTFLILKVLYRDRAQITDIFLFAVASILLIVVSAASYIAVQYTFNNFIIAYVLNRILLFGILYVLRNKIRIWYKKFVGLWNRKPNQKIRSLTVRNVSVIIFNVMFYIINFGMVYFVTFLKK
jgi:hypothetical protein